MFVYFGRDIYIQVPPINKMSFDDKWNLSKQNSQHKVFNPGSSFLPKQLKDITKSYNIRWHVF